MRGILTTLAMRYKDDSLPKVNAENDGVGNYESPRLIILDIYLQKMNNMRSK